MRKTIDVRIPIKAISTNRLYFGKKRRSTEYKKYREAVLNWLELNYPYPAVFPKNMILTMEVGFSSPLSDASNSIKGIEDIVAEFFGFNDRQIVEVHICKMLVDKGAEYTHLKIRGTTKDIDRRTKKCQKR